MSDLIAVNEILSLTSFRPEDKAGLQRYLDDPEVFRNTLTIPSPYTEEEANKWLTHTAEQRALLGHEGNWAIRHRDVGYIGGIGIFFRTGWEGHLDEIGYALGAPFRGQGWMTEVVRTFVDWQLAQRPRLARIEAYTFPPNIASGRVLEKAGFVREGYLRKRHLKNGRLEDAVLWARIRED